MLCLETLCIKSGKICNLRHHDARFNTTREKLFDVKKIESLKDLITVPRDLETDRIYRCRILYQEKIETLEFIPYVEKKIQKIKLLEIPTNFDYTYKWADRIFFAKLLRDYADADEVLMIKNGYITDCTIANVAFFDGSNWFTPSTPLLRGTRRAQLLAKKKIFETEIKTNDLSKYKKLILINTFRDLDEAKVIAMATVE